MMAGASKELVTYVQAERVRAAARWHRPEPRGSMRRTLAD
jgi:hypothetical protein